jgi:5'(3')-deoxyribonucleotidase
MKHIFLDMDGVIADFFGAWAARLNGKNWQDIKQVSQEKREQDIRDLAQNPADVEDFFANLGMLAGGRVLLNYFKVNHISFTILSAPLVGAGHQASIRGKERWLSSHGLNSVNKIFTVDKYVYAVDDQNQPNILIDDYGVNIQAWRSHGGIAIHHSDDTVAQTLSQLKKQLNQP